MEAQERHIQLENPRGRARATNRLGQLRMAQGRLEHAHELLLEAEAGFMAVSELRGAGLALAMTGVVLLLQGLPAAAIDPLRTAAERLSAGDEAARALLIWKAAALACALTHQPARPLPDLTIPPWLRAASERMDAAIALALSDTPATRSQTSQLLGRAPDTCFEGHMAQRLLGLTLARMDARTAHQVSSVHIAPDGRWFRVGDAALYDLSRRTHPARLLALLADTRCQTPGRLLGVEQLFEAGWPGEQAQRKAMRQRVHTAIYTLRKAGLAEVLECIDAAYRISPTAQVQRVIPGT